MPQKKQDDTSTQNQVANISIRALDDVSAYIYTKDLKGCYTYANKLVLDLFKVTLDELYGKDDSHFFSLHESNELAVNDQLVMSKGITVESEERNVIKETGETRYYWTVKKPIKDDTGKVIGLNGISTDITEQKTLQFHLKEKEALLNTVINNVDAYIYMKDANGRFLFVNDKTADLFGLPANQVKGKNTKEILPPELADNFDILDHELISKGEMVEGEEAIESDDGESKHYWSKKVPIKDEFGRVTSFIGFSTEITKVIKEKKGLEVKASTDELTGTSNRRHFMSTAYSAHKKAVDSKGSLSVLMIDLDHFKSINDLHGHHMGDKVLKEVAYILRNNVRENDLVGRMGGEEFSIILPDTGYTTAFQVAEKLRVKISESLINDIQVTASIGVAECPLSTDGLNRALIKADEALYLAKNNGRNCVR